MIYNAEEEMDLDDDNLKRRSKRKKIPKIKNDETYSRQSSNSSKYSTNESDSGISSVNGDASLDDIESSFNAKPDIDDMGGGLKNDLISSYNGLEVLSPLKSDFVRLGPTINCFKCDSLFETRYAIIFTQRFFCCRECLPEETTRELRLGSIIKQCTESAPVRDRKARRCSVKKSYVHQEETCPIADCDGSGNVNPKFTYHKSINGCPLAYTRRKIVKSKKRDVKQSSTPVVTPQKTPPHEEEMHVLQNEVKDAPKEECPLNNEVDEMEDSRLENEVESIRKELSPPLTPPSPTQLQSTPLLVAQAAEKLSTVIPTSVIKLSKKERMKCPFPGCDSLGHRNKRYPTHRSLFGCPKVAALSKEDTRNGCPFPSCDGQGSLLPNQSQHTTLNTCPRLNIEHERSCPIEGCDGKGHRSGRHTTHRSVTTCPYATKEQIHSFKLSSEAKKPESLSKSPLLTNKNSPLLRLHKETQIISQVNSELEQSLMPLQQNLSALTSATDALVGKYNEEQTLQCEVHHKRRLVIERLNARFGNCLIDESWTNLPDPILIEKLKHLSQTWRKCT